MCTFATWASTIIQASMLGLFLCKNIIVLYVQPIQRFVFLIYWESGYITWISYRVYPTGKNLLWLDMTLLMTTRIPKSGENSFSRSATTSLHDLNCVCATPKACSYEVWAISNYFPRHDAARPAHAICCESIRLWICLNWLNDCLNDCLNDSEVTWTYFCDWIKTYQVT